MIDQKYNFGDKLELAMQDGARNKFRDKLELRIQQDLEELMEESRKLGSLQAKTSPFRRSLNNSGGRDATRPQQRPLFCFIPVPKEETKLEPQ